MELIKALQGGESLDAICERYQLNRVDHEDGRTILNYDQVFSKPKNHPIVRECRGLVIDRFNNRVAARAFPRFFNLGEDPESDKAFDWNSAVVQEKVDGSLVLFYFWNGSWRINTRGSFAQGQCGNSGRSWDELIRPLFKPVHPTRGRDATYVFEFCSPWNQVVAYHPEPKLVLLGVFDNCSGSEWHEWDVWIDAVDTEVEQPKTYPIGSAEDCVKFLTNPEIPATFEGFVVKDWHGNRVKIKNARYVALHHLKGNGNGFLTKNLVPLILAGESDEVAGYFPDSADRIRELEKRLNDLMKNSVDEYAKVRNIEVQKDFALAIGNLPFKSILFMARSIGKEPDQILREKPELAVKLIGD